MLPMNMAERACGMPEIMADPRHYFLKALLNRGVNPLSRDEKGNTHLYEAAVERRTDAVKILLESIELQSVQSSELRAELVRAKSHVHGRDWKMVRIIERFEYTHNLHLFQESDQSPRALSNIEEGASRNSFHSGASSLSRVASTLRGHFAPTPRRDTSALVSGFHPVWGGSWCG
ncbi:uncharacterized protein BJX67DRAFT_276919 [Aspergillus lucknowensis]|uniref:Ankyrin repeat-containing domain protein n=1 Tax=Aspergillus lucknowensis TaxID=176173 RepID=A0ABR4M0E7_9EURO